MRDLKATASTHFRALPTPLTTSNQETCEMVKGGGLCSEGKVSAWAGMGIGKGPQNQQLVEKRRETGGRAEAVEGRGTS